MKILLVNKFYHPNRGADKYFLFLESLLRSKGHEVRIFAMDSEKNLPSPDSSYFSEKVDLRDRNLLQQLKVAGKIIYNNEAKRRFARLLKDFKPDVIHCHNIYHQISPSILEAAKEAKIPVVMHLHDYKLICPNYRLYSQGSDCRRCRKHRYWQCLRYRCVENSLPKSALAALEMTIHHQFKHIYRDNVNRFIAPSRFMKEVCVEFGWPADSFRILENITPVKNIEPTDGNYFLYFGALAEEKGVDILVKAAATAGIKLKIVGSGEENNRLQDLSHKLGVEADFAGQLSGESLDQAIAGSRAVVIPSRWPENMPLAGIEAMSAGKPLIAAAIGGLTELVKDGYNGYLFSPGNTEELSKCLLKLTPAESIRMGNNARASRRGKDVEWHYKELMAIYHEIKQ